MLAICGYVENFFRRFKQNVLTRFLWSNTKRWLWAHIHKIRFGSWHAKYVIVWCSFSFCFFLIIYSVHVRNILIYSKCLFFFTHKSTSPWPIMQKWIYIVAIHLLTLKGPGRNNLRKYETSTNSYIAVHQQAKKKWTI